jgi:preprotein translocase subunit Sss1
MEVQEGVMKTVKDFTKGSVRLVKRCSKPDRKGEALGSL